MKNARKMQGGVGGIGENWNSRMTNLLLLLMLRSCHRTAGLHRGCFYQESNSALTPTGVLPRRACSTMFLRTPRMQEYGSKSESLVETLPSPNSLKSCVPPTSRKGYYSSP